MGERDRELQVWSYDATINYGENPKRSTMRGKGVFHNDVLPMRADTTDETLVETIRARLHEVIDAIPDKYVVDPRAYWGISIWGANEGLTPKEKAAQKEKVCQCGDPACEYPVYEEDE